MPNETTVEEILIDRKISVRKTTNEQTSEGAYKTQEQTFGSLDPDKTAENYKSVADNIGWLMENRGTADQPSDAFQLDKFIVEEVEENGGDE